MGIREFTKSGAFVATVFALVVVLMPFAIEQIGEATNMFSFPVSKTISGWFSFGKPAPVQTRAATAVDWDRYMKDLETFTKWIEERDAVAIFRPLHDEEVIRVKEVDSTPKLRLWPISVASCTAGETFGQPSGYVFISGFDRPFQVGTVIKPSEGLCGYEVLFVGERTVWFRAVFEDEGDVRMEAVKFPEFTRVEGKCLVRGSRRYVARDAFQLASGGWLMIDSFMPPSSVVFKILDEKRKVVATMLCVVISEKGGRQ